MTKIEDFKKFVSYHPEFIEYVKNDKTSWQKLYELYDIYGEKESIWKKYLESKDSVNIKGILSSLKNINLDSLEDNINNIQKAVSLVEEFTRSDKKEEENKPKREEVNNIYGDKDEHKSAE